MKDFYWDIRPKPEYGTIEIRICDTPLTVELAAQLAAYAQTLAADLLQERRIEPFAPLYRVYGYNRFQACRFGFEGTLIDAATGRARPLADDLRETLRLLAPHAQMLDSQDAFAALTETIDQGNHATWLRRAFAETGTLQDVVRQQAELWAAVE